MSSNDRRLAEPARCGFSLVELVVVVLILGVLAGVAAPRLLDVTTEAEAAAIVARVNRLFDAVERYSAEHNELPADVYSGDTPPELEGYLRDEVLAESTGFGTALDWNGPGTTAPVYGADIRVDDWSDPAAVRLYDALEEHADDGDRSSGWITADTRRVFFRLINR